MEEWRDIKGYEDWYQISNFGRVRSLDREVVYSNKKKYKYVGKILNPTLKKTGYYYVSLSKNNVRPKFDVHRLVAMAFLDNPNNYPCVNHIDGVKTNNNVSNLEWCTFSQNSIHADNAGLYTRTYGEINGMSKLTKDKVLEIRELLSNGEKGIHIAKKFNISISTVSMIKNKKLWSHI